MAAVLRRRRRRRLVVWLLLLLLLSTTFTTFSSGGGVGVVVVAAAATWCVARSEASDNALQTALDYACWAGADCGPIQPSGLCYLPNTVQAHASYAFNSYFQRRGNAPDSCSFAGTSTFARTDPSYGSCVYPSSPRTAGGTTASGGTAAGSTTPGTTPIVIQPPPTPPPGTTNMPLYGNGGGSTPGTGTVVPDPPRGDAATSLSPVTLLLLCFSILQATLGVMFNH